MRTVVEGRHRVFYLEERCLRVGGAVILAYSD